MLKKFLFIFYLCLTSFGANALPDCNKPESECVPAPGCEWKGETIGCSACDDNYYYEATTDANTGVVTAECKACPSGYPNSDAGSTNGISDCYKTCTVTNPQSVLVSDRAYYNNICETTLRSIDCTNGPGLTSVCPGGTITGTAPYSTSNNSYDFSFCKCEKNKTGFSNGTATETCSFNANGTEVLTTGCTTTIKNCNDGYCSANGQSCITIPENYYKNGINCVQCPAGSYRSGNETTCSWDNRTTFTDGNGRIFTIPASGKIIAK